MKREHIAIVLDSYSDFERSSIDFKEFLEKLGLAVESATPAEEKCISEIVQELEIAILSGFSEEINGVLLATRKKFISQINSCDDVGVGSHIGGTQRYEYMSR